jgi:hypothetical protein
MNAKMKGFLTLSNWLPMGEMKSKATALALRITERWDVPSGPHVKPDLRDIVPRWFGTRDGHRIAGLMLGDDIGRGFVSPATPLLFNILPLLFLVSNILGTVAGRAGALVPMLAAAAVFVAIGRICGLFASVVSLLPYCLPLIVGALTGGFSTLGGAQNGFNAALVLGSCVLVVLWFLYLLQDGNAKIRSAGETVAILMAVIAGYQYAPPIVREVYWYLVSCGVGAGFSYYQYRNWLLRVGEQGNELTLESSGPGFSHITAREKQALTAAADTSAFIQLGVAKGVFTKKMDGYAPDPGQIVGLTALDLSVHIALFGFTGSGKSSCGMRPTIIGWIRSKSGGVLILDAKSDLPGEFRGMKDYLLIEPGVPLALIQGLSPTDIVQALDSVDRAQSKGSAEQGKFWEAQSRQMIFAGGTFLEAVIAAEKIKHGYGDDDDRRMARWHLHGLYSLLSRAQRGTAATAQIMDDLIALVRQYIPEANEVGVLFDSIEYLELNLPAMDVRTRSDVWSTVQNKFHPFLSDKRLAPWAHCEKGVDVDIVLRGGKVGIAVPAAKYGICGTYIQALVKQRVYTGIRRRGGRNWLAAGEKPVLLAIDEADEIVGSKADIEMLKNARSLGLSCAFATQSFDAYVSRFGDIHTAESFIANFRNRLSFVSTKATGELMQRMFGTTMNLTFQSSGYGINFIKSAKEVAASPLYDSEHEGSSLYKSMLRKGAGALRARRHSGKGVLRDGSSVGLDSSSERWLTKGVEGGQWKEGPLMSLSEWDSILREPQVAVVEVLRGGVPRRDFIQCTPIFEIPADLIQQPEEKTHEPA